MRTHAVCAAFAGLALRIFFVLRFPSTDAGDTPFYIELAWNWLKKGVYGAAAGGQLVPLDSRVPGYPAFLAAIFSVAGRSLRAVMLAQAAVDLAACFLIALIAARLAPEPSRQRVAIAGLWLAALCPFTANYSATILTETLVTFLTALAILLLMRAYADEAQAAAGFSAPSKPALSLWFLGGIMAGFGSLVRPETPLLLAAVGLALICAWWRKKDWSKLARAAVLMAAGFMLPLLPWAARNWRSLHEVQFLAPRHLQSGDDFVPRGFDAWMRTWLWRFGDVYLTDWKLNSEEIPIESLPAAAFDTPEEYARVSAILDEYNDTLTLTREQDAEFAAIARERTSRRPLRTYLGIPVLRTLALWFTPRVELLPFSGHMWPIGEKWEDDRRDFLVTLGLGFVNLVYIGLALAGAWMARHQPGWGLLVAFIAVRTGFIATAVETPEPRYVLECFPAVLALGAQTFSWKGHLSSTGSG